ncbi:MAG: dihydrofolate reductase [Pseudomonadota bacterium]
MSVKLSLIVAMAENNVIGINNEIPWYIPDDLKYFKSVTMGKPCVMGRKTFDSIIAKLGKPLPGRQSIVISRSNFEHDEAIGALSIEDAIDKAKVEADKQGVNEVMVIGGAQIYEQTLPNADRLYLTKVHQKYDGDAFFPAFDEKDWETSMWDDHGDYSFLTLER